MGFFDRNKNDKKDSTERYPNYTLRMIGGAYLVYLAWDFYQGYRTETLQDVSPTTALIGAAFFAISGIVIFVLNLRGDMRLRRKLKEEEEARYAPPKYSKANEVSDDEFYNVTASARTHIDAPVSEEPVSEEAASEEPVSGNVSVYEDDDDFYGVSKKEDNDEQ